MKIECPSCHLTGNINAVDIPSEGRNFECPRCKTAFFINKPAPEADGGDLMSMCPVCQYSTFTDEMFAVCPKCGTKGSDYRKMLLEKSGGKQRRRPIDSAPPEPPQDILDREQMQRDFERLSRSQRNPDFEAEPHPEVVVKRPSLPLPIRITGWVAVAAGGLILLYGLAGLFNYYGKDWQAILSVPFLEPVSKIRIFFRLGLFPWLKTIFGICFLLTASRYLLLAPWAPRALIGMCLGGMGLVLAQEVAGIVGRILITSGYPSAIFYLDCLVSFLLRVFLWSAPFLALTWLLTREDTVRDYAEAQSEPDRRPSASHS